MSGMTPPLESRATATTPRIHVTVRTRFLASESDPGEGRWVYAYTITIANRGDRACQLRSRHWIITDGLGREEHVRGAGVVGQQPWIQPGGQFEYTSGCPLKTPVGSMRGEYRLVDEDGFAFDAEIPAFALVRSELTN